MTIALSPLGHDANGARRCRAGEDYYSGYNIVTQNSAGDLLFKNNGSMVHLFAGDSEYAVDFLEDEGLGHSEGLYYFGSLTARGRP